MSHRIGNNRILNLTRYGLIMNRFHGQAVFDGTGNASLKASFTGLELTALCFSYYGVG